MRESVLAFSILTVLTTLTLDVSRLSAQTKQDVDASASPATLASAITPSTRQPSPGNAKPNSTAEQAHIAGGDLLEVNVYGLDDMSQKVRVDSEGEISLQLLGQVHVGDLTTAEAEKLLAKLSVEKGILKDPHFAVFIKDDVQGGVSVLGEVNKPGIYELEGTRHLLEAISAAGGVTNRAGNIVNITRRDNPDQVIKVELRQDGQDPATNIAIYPGDTIVVAKAPLVYVVGEVQRPSGLVMENGERMTVLQAIALAQGTTKTAKLSATRIIRKSPDGQYHEIPLALGDMLKAKKPDVTLQKEDIVFVPTSVTKTVMGTTLQSAVQIAVGAAIYKP
ncbi:MAG: polysaccharide biosynthesis/export family protein [Candidatus Korobacteraceae bacterium]